MRNKADVDRLAEVYANDSYEIENGTATAENFMKLAGQTTQTHQFPRDFVVMLLRFNF